MGAVREAGAKVVPGSICYPMCWVVETSRDTSPWAPRPTYKGLLTSKPFGTYTHWSHITDTNGSRSQSLLCPSVPLPPHIESRRSSRPIKSPSYPFSSFPRCIYHLRTRTTLNSLFASPGSSSWTTMGFEELVSRVESLTRTYGWS